MMRAESLLSNPRLPVPMAGKEMDLYFCAAAIRKHSKTNVYRICEEETTILLRYRQQTLLYQNDQSNQINALIEHVFERLKYHIYTQ